MVSCVFCSCELPSRVGRAKYQEHLQDWHLITRPEEVARALALAFPAAGEQERAAAMEVEVAGKVAASRVQEEEEKEDDDDDDEVVIMELPQGRPAASPRTGVSGDQARARAVVPGARRPRTKVVAVVVSRVEASEALARYRASRKVEEGQARGGVEEEVRSVVEEVSSMVVEESSGQKCHLCGEEWKRSDRLADHMRMKHGAAKLRCRKENCPKEFRSTSGFYWHMKTAHRLVVMSPWARNLRLVAKGGSVEGEAKPAKAKEAIKVKCPMESCNKMFLKKRYLLKHMRRVHRVKEEVEDMEEKRGQDKEQGKEIKVTLGVPMEEVQENDAKARAEVAEKEDIEKKTEGEKEGGGQEELRVEKEARQKKGAEEELRLVEKEKGAQAVAVQENEAQEGARVQELEKEKEFLEDVGVKEQEKENFMMEVIELAEDFQQKAVQEKVDERDPLDLGSEVTE